MKKISKLICLILSLIFVLTTAGCDLLWDLMIPKVEFSWEEDQLANLELVLQVEKEIDGYELVYDENDYIDFENSDLTLLTTADGDYISERVKKATANIRLTRVRDSLVKTITFAMIIEKSQSAKELTEIFDETKMGYFGDSSRSFGLLATIVPFDNKLFIAFAGTPLLTIADVFLPMPGYEKWSPPLFFEYDIQTEEIKYAGCVNEVQNGIRSQPHKVKIIKTN
ncbi:MAG: hypothetical protein J6V68_00475 [Clostridia bacterium]|nr:hypothetical protein [Clostridia bacterium]